MGLGETGLGEMGQNRPKTDFDMIVAWVVLTWYRRLWRADGQTDGIYRS